MGNDDIRERARRRLAGKSAKQIGGTAAKRLTGNVAERLHERSEARANVPLELIMLFDTTGSMMSYVNRVKDCTKAVGSEIFEAEKGIEARILGIGDHCDTEKIRRSGATLLGDYGQFNPAVSNVRLLCSQIDAIVGTDGGDAPEAYECMGADVAQMIVDDRKTNADKMYVTVFFGDATPHGIQGAGWDQGCPFQNGPEQLTVLANVADRSYWVDCSTGGRSGFEQHTYGQVSGIQTATYLKFSEAQEVLPEAIIGMVKQTRGNFDEYLAKIKSTKGELASGQVKRLLLGSGK